MASLLCTGHCCSLIVEGVLSLLLLALLLLLRRQRWRQCWRHHACVRLLHKSTVQMKAPAAALVAHTCWPTFLHCVHLADFLPTCCCMACIIL